MVLKVLRDGAKSGFARFILFGLMTLAVFGLVLMDIGGFFRTGAGSNNVAKIGKEHISAPAFDNMVRSILSRQGLDATTAYQLGFINQILHAEVMNNLAYQAARDMGIHIGDKAIAQQVAEILEPYVGQGMDRNEAFRRILMNQNMTERQFVQALRTEMTNTILRNALLLGASYVSDDEAHDLYQFRNEERVVEAIIFPHSTIKDYTPPADEVLLPLYQAGQERYAIPETRTLTIATLSPDSLQKSASVSDDELRDIYEQDKENFTQPEQRTLEQAVFAEQDKALAVLEQVKKGAALKDAVKAVTGGTTAYLGADNFQESGLAKEIAAPAFKADKGAVLDPVQTPLGWHVMIVKDILPPDVKPFAAVKEELRREALHNKLAEQLQSLSADIDDALAGGATLEDVASEKGLTLKTYPPIRDDGSTTENKEGLKDFPNDRDYIAQTGFELLEGETSPVMELRDGGYAVMRVDAITPKSYKPFEDVKSEIGAIWIKDQQEVLNRTRMQEALKLLASGEKTLAQVAADNGTDVRTFRLKRSDEVKAPLTPGARDSFFGTPKDGYTSTAVQDGLAVAKVTSVTLPDAAKIPASELKTIKETISKNLSDEALQIYMQSLYERYKVTINDRLLQTMYGPGSEQQEP